jgi:hypothetical protein
VYDPEALLKSRRARPGMVEETRKVAGKTSPRVADFEEVVVGEADDVDLPPDAADDDAALIEDAAELGEDTIEEVEVEVDPGEDEE